MELAKVFSNGGSQAVRLPKSCRFDDNEVYVNRIGNLVMLVPKNDPWTSVETGLNLFSDDFLQSSIEDLPVQKSDIKVTFGK